MKAVQSVILIFTRVIFGVDLVYWHTQPAAKHERESKTYGNFHMKIFIKELYNKWGASWQGKNWQ
jgi:hypothetical protein